MNQDVILFFIDSRISKVEQHLAACDSKMAVFGLIERGLLKSELDFLRDLRRVVVGSQDDTGPGKHEN